MVVLSKVRLIGFGRQRSGGARILARSAHGNFDRFCASLAGEIWSVVVDEARGGSLLALSTERVHAALLLQTTDGAYLEGVKGERAALEVSWEWRLRWFWRGNLIDKGRMGKPGLALRCRICRASRRRLHVDHITRQSAMNNIAGFLLRRGTVGKVCAMAQAHVYRRLGYRPAVHRGSARRSVQPQIGQSVLGVVLLLADSTTLGLLSAPEAEDQCS